MDYINLIIGLTFLILLSFIDFFTYKKKDGNIPSFLTSTFLLVSFIINPNIQFLILYGLIGLLFSDMEQWSGLSDLKTFIAAGLLLNSFLWFPLILSALTIVYKLIGTRMKLRDIPYIPLILVAFSISFLL